MLRYRYLGILSPTDYSVRVLKAEPNIVAVGTTGEGCLSYRSYFEPGIF